MTMRKLWLCACALASILVIGEGVLISRALAAIDREERLEHERVAARVASELDRRLGDLIAGEAERPFTQYRYFSVPNGSVAGALALEVTPLARVPEQPWLIGHFQIDPDGSFHSPLRPRNEELARLTTSWVPVPEVTRRLEVLQRCTLSLHTATGSVSSLRSVDQSIDGMAQAISPSLAQVEGSLNNIGRNRAGKSSSVQVPARSVYNFQNDDGNALQRGVAASNGVPSSSGTAPASVEQLQCEVQQEVYSHLNTADETIMEVSQGPLRRVGIFDGIVVLAREVSVAGSRYRQGFAIQLDRLGADIASKVLDEIALGDVLAVDFTAAADPRPGYAYALRHVCADPFTDLVATVQVRALPGAVPDARRTVWWLGGGLIAATVMGVWALAGMVAAALRFARRRQDFVAAVSHELKTPLTAIRLHAEMLRDGLVSEPTGQRESHATIVAESERLSRLIGNVLELARLERDDRPVQIMVGDPLLVLHEVARIVEPHAAGHGFTVAVSGSGVPARFDRDALVQVVMNLVDNAIKFSRHAPDRRIELALSTAADGAPVIAVRDHGPGVPPADLRRIFEPFWRGERELTRSTTGTGIGLALVRSLVERMGGRVEARNRPEGGFEVALALSPA